MATSRETGSVEKTDLKKTYQETQIEWRISDIAAIDGINNNNLSVHIFYSSPSFFINGVQSALKMYLKSHLDNEFTRLYINSNVTVDASVDLKFSSLEYSVSLKKLDGNEEFLASGILKKESYSNYDMGNIIKRSELLQRRFELIPQNVLTIMCRLKREVTSSSEDNTKTLQLIRLEKLSENFSDLFDDKETCNVTLKVKDKEYKAHRSVLIARSTVFAANFKHDTLERQTGVITISDCDPDSFEVFLRYIYSGKLEDVSPSNAFDLYYTSDKYDVQELKTFCVEYLMKGVTVENLCEVAVLADKHDETELLSAVQEFFNKNARKIFLTSQWDDLMTKHHRLAKTLLIEMSNVKLND